MDKHQTKQLDRKTQRERFEEAARESGADMGKKEFSRVLGKIVKAKPKLGKTRSEKPES